MAALVPASNEWSVLSAIAAALAALLLLLCLVLLGLAVFPRLEGPKGSLIYFGGIVANDLTAYETSLLAASDDEIASDYAKQIHRNAQIAAAKFGRVRGAMIALFAALLPWLAAIALLYRT